MINSPRTENTQSSSNYQAQGQQQYGGSELMGAVNPFLNAQQTMPTTQPTYGSELMGAVAPFLNTQQTIQQATYHPQINSGQHYSMSGYIPQINTSIPFLVFNRIQNELNQNFPPINLLY